jgi:hypothetical protein
LSNNAPDNVLLLDEGRVNIRLRLVEPPFDKCPNQSMQERLDENDSTDPAMQKVEVLVRNTGDERQDTFTRAKSDCERCQCISKGSNTIAPTSEAGSDRLQIRMALGGRDPGLVSDTDETVLGLVRILSALVRARRTRRSKDSQEVQTAL